MVKVLCKIINLSLPNLACFASWRESNPRVRLFQIIGKFARSAPYVFFVPFAVNFLEFILRSFVVRP
jgi:hypothetical protein